MQHDPTLKDWLDGIREGCTEMGYEVSYADLILLMGYPTERWSRPADYPPEMGCQVAGGHSFSATGRPDKGEPQAKAE